MGPVLRIAGTWVVTTALIVLGVNAAVERVARDVSIARPTPMTPSEVDEQLREQQGTAPTTTGADSRSTSEPTTSTPTSPSTGPTTGPTTGSPMDPPKSEPPQPDVTRPSAPGGPPIDVGTTTTVPRGSPGGPDEREDPPRP